MIANRKWMSVHQFKCAPRVWRVNISPAECPVQIVHLFAPNLRLSKHCTDLSYRHRFLVILMSLARGIDVFTAGPRYAESVHNARVLLQSWSDGAVEDEATAYQFRHGADECKIGRREYSRLRSDRLWRHYVCHEWRPSTVALIQCSDFAAPVESKAY